MQQNKNRWMLVHSMTSGDSVLLMNYIFDKSAIPSFRQKTIISSFLLLGTEDCIQKNQKQTTSN